MVRQWRGKMSEIRGEHPVDRRMEPLSDDMVDDGIIGVVRLLRDAGVHTYSSCQGGGYLLGHGYLLPTVCFEGDDEEGERAEKIADGAGYQVRQISRTWYTRDGERMGPFWELQFVMGAACRAPKDRWPSTPIPGEEKK
jgi:hypothetical protein